MLMKLTLGCHKGLRQMQSLNNFPVILNLLFSNNLPMSKSSGLIKWYVSLFFTFLTHFCVVLFSVTKTYKGLINPKFELKNEFLRLEFLKYKK